MGAVPCPCPCPCMCVVLLCLSLVSVSGRATARLRVRTRVMFFCLQIHLALIPLCQATHRACHTCKAIREAYAQKCALYLVRTRRRRRPSLQKYQRAQPARQPSAAAHVRVPARYMRLLERRQRVLSCPPRPPRSRRPRSRSRPRRPRSSSRHRHPGSWREPHTRLPSRRRWRGRFQE